MGKKRSKKRNKKNIKNQMQRKNEIKDIKHMENIKDTEPSKSIEKSFELRGTPLLLDYVLGFGAFLKYLGIFVGVLFVIVLCMSAITILASDGFKEFIHFVTGLVTFWKWDGSLLPAILIFVPFVCWWYFATHIMKDFKGKQYRVHNLGVTIIKNGRFQQEVSYHMIKDAIPRKKVRIGPDWVEIPYENKRFRVYSQDKDDIVSLFHQLRRKCDFSFPIEELEETLKEYMVGWAITYLFGVPCTLFGCYAVVIAFFTEQVFSLSGLVSMLFSKENVIGIVGMAIIFIGYMVKFTYYDLLKRHFKPYKQHIRVSL